MKQKHISYSFYVMVLLIWLPSQQNGMHIAHKLRFDNPN